MPTNLAHAPAPPIRARPAEPRDLDALLALEHRVFASDRLSRRSLRHFLRSASARVLVADDGAALVGAAVVLFRPNSSVARLYSIAVAPHLVGRGIGAMLLAAAEEAALARDCTSMRLEVHDTNAVAIARYRKSGYRQFGRHEGYYADGGDALRFEKRLARPLSGPAAAPPYFHQTTEFTCGPACIMMALAWADRNFRPSPPLEFQLWREASTICMSGAGPGGCEPFGLAVTLKRRGLLPEIYVSRPGPYFVDTVRDPDKQRVMRLTQSEFQREAQGNNILSHLTPVSESVLMRAFDAGSVAIVLVSGYQMIPRGRPHWIFAFGRDGRHVLMHDPAAVRDDQGMALAPETYAVPWTAFERMTQVKAHGGSDRLSAAVIVRKG
jgi:ribosomal protein S18 acetylase RimI-like enzyme